MKQETECTSVKVFNDLGQMVLNGPVLKDDLINVQQFENGIYFFKENDKTVKILVRL